MPTIKKTRALVCRVLSGRDQGGEPDSDHAEGVWRNLRLLFPDCTESEQKAALLHDIIEDGKGWNSTTLEELGYGGKVIRLVRAVTKLDDLVKKEKGHYLEDAQKERARYQGEKLTYEDNIRRVIAAGPSAVRLKLADLTHNLRPDRLHYLSPEKLMNRHDKYLPALEMLLEDLERREGPEERARVQRAIEELTMPYGLLASVQREQARCRETELPAAAGAEQKQAQWADVLWEMLSKGMEKLGSGWKVGQD